MSRALADVGRLIATQDNRITEAPIFAVQERRRIYGVDDSGNEEGFEWRDDDWELAPTHVADALEHRYAFTGEEPTGWSRHGFVEVWEFVTACFTEQGCKDYLAANGHNHRETRIYAYGSFRNAEWQAVRDHLITLGAEPAR